METEVSSDTPAESDDTKSKKDVVPQSDMVSNGDANKESDNTWLYILAVVIAIVFLFTLVIALSDSKRSNTSDAETTE